MSVALRIESLKKKHQALSDEVEKLSRSPGVPSEDIAKLKKQKLALKEEMRRLLDSAPAEKRHLDIGRAMVSEMPRDGDLSACIGRTPAFAVAAE